MFMCEKCSKGKVDAFWFTIGAISVGLCEICNKKAKCLDVQACKNETNQQCSGHRKRAADLRRYITERRKYV